MQNVYFNKFVISLALILVWNPFLQRDFKAKREEGNYEPDERGDENAAERS